MKWTFPFFLYLLFCLNPLLAWETPVLVLPANQALMPTSVLIDWNAVPLSTAYQLEFDTAATFNSPLRQRIQKNYIGSSNSGNDTKHQFNNLYFGEVYYWRVRAWQANDTSQWSATRGFSTLGIVPIQSPANAQLDLNQGSVTLDWYSHPGALQYHLQVDTTNLFNSVSLQNFHKTYTDTSSNAADSRQVINTNLSNHVYFWRVRAINSTDTSAWHLRWFSTGIANIFVPNAPTQLAPEQGLTEQATTQTFQWSSSEFANLYQIYIDTIPQLNNPLIYTIPDTSLTVEILKPNQTYYWYVRAFNTETIVSAWSPLRSFRTYTFIAQPTIVEPLADAVDVDLNTVFRWDPVPFATHYRFRLATNDSLGGMVEIETSNSQLEFDTLIRKQQYFWSVQAFRDTSFESVASDTISFRLAALHTPQPVFPIHEAQLIDNSSIFSWTPIDEEAQYELRLSFESDVMHSYVLNTLNTSLEEDSLVWGATYSWNVRAVSDSGNSAWSEMREFLVINPVGIESTKRQEISFWPNPAHSSIQFNRVNTVRQVKIIRSDGVLIRSINDKEIHSELKIDLSEFPAGIYSVFIETKEGKWISSRLIKD
ncbi:MAG TPA: hypothetical protein PL185_02860 [Flavobacteriales bacterium]|nr:hypothetical protein [Flavobacteriales bacterium]HPH81481.1 hypothetical protein [Flavobacteriales bacterium]